VNGDGLVVAKPRRRSRHTTIRGLALMIAVIMIFKAVLLAQLGPIAYDERVEKLANGNLVEQMGAWAMTADPVTNWLSGHIVSLVR
jgi:hypothetical protein